MLNRFRLPYSATFQDCNSFMFLSLHRFPYSSMLVEVHGFALLSVIHIMWSCTTTLHTCIWKPDIFKLRQIFGICLSFKCKLSY